MKKLGGAKRLLKLGYYPGFVITLKDLMDATKAVSGNLTMMRYHDLLMGQAINTFGRVA